MLWIAGVGGWVGGFEWVLGSVGTGVAGGGGRGNNSNKNGEK